VLTKIGGVDSYQKLWEANKIHRKQA